MFKKILLCFFCVVSFFGAVSTGFAYTNTQLVPAVCGPDNEKALTSMPTQLCTVGTPSLVFGTGPWSWTCSMGNLEADAECSATESTPNSVVISLADKIQIDQLIAVIKYGEISDNVRQLQDKLKTLNLFPQDVVSSGYYGEITAAAIEKYESSATVATVVTPTDNNVLNRLSRAELITILMNLIKSFTK